MNMVSIYDGTATEVLGQAPPEFCWAVAAWYMIGMGVLSILVGAAIYFLHWKQDRMLKVANKLFGMPVLVITREDANEAARKLIGRELHEGELRSMARWLEHWFHDWGRAVEEGLCEIIDEKRFNEED